MTEILGTITSWVNATQIPLQIREVDVHGLFTNGYFLIPLLTIVCYLIYRGAIGSLVLLGLVIGLWVFSGSQYMQEIRGSEEIQLDKILPLVLGGVGIIAVIVYLFFIRDS